MEFKQLIEARRSVRAFREPAGHDDLLDILALAGRAPSWKNSQTARTYLVEGERTDAARAALPSFNQNSSKNAALIVTTFITDISGYTQGAPDNDGGNFWGAYDLGLRDAYLVLAAKELGFDTLIMGLRDAETLRATLDIPQNEQIMSVIAVGRAADAPELRPRKPLDEVVRY